MPAVVTEAGTLAEQTFQSAARNKKLAIAAAADLGLAFLKQQPIFQSFKPPDLLWDTVKRLLSEQVLRKEPEFEGHVLLTQQLNNGWIPVQLLALARPIQQWVKQNLPAALKSPETFHAEISARLENEALPQAVQAEVEWDSKMRCLMRKVEYTGRQGFNIVQPLKATLETGAGRRYKAVLIPADPREQIAEIAIRGGGYVCQEVASALGVPCSKVLYWGKFGRSQHVYLDPYAVGEEVSDADLRVLLGTYFGAENSKEANGGRETAPAESQRGDDSTSSTSNGLPLTEIRQPVLYSRAEAAVLNQRASWLVGKEVHGHAVASFCRLRPCEWRTPSMKWGSLSLTAFWAWLGAGLPSPEYARSCHLQMLAGLPHIYRHVKSWFGSPPTELLSQHISPSICAEGPEFDCKAVSDDPGAEWEASATVRLVGDVVPLAAKSAGCSSEDVARQQAALLLLHQFQRRFCSIFGHGFHDATTDAEGAKELQVLERGDGGAPHAASVIFFNYKVTGTEGRFSRKILGEGSGRLEWGAGGIIPQVEDLIAAANPGGRASCSIKTSLDFLNPLQPCFEPARLEILSDQKVRFVGAVQTAQSLFDPPMATQRCELMTALVKKHRAATVLDIGCGDCRLTEHLLKQAKQQNIGIETIVGVDLDPVAVRRGAKRIRERNPGIFDGPSAPHLELYQADIACQDACTPSAWGRFVGADAAIFQEVVEHLDPVPLTYLGPCLLAALQPKLLLLSTPNIEYNPVLHYLQNQLLPNGLRNSDHRFEWTRQEFQEWCRALALQHGYSVAFQGLGKAAEEARALEDPSTAFYGKDVGSSTQLAVFERLEAVVGCTEGNGVRGCRIFTSKDLDKSNLEEEFPVAGGGNYAKPVPDSMTASLSPLETTDSVSKRLKLGGMA